MSGDAAPVAATDVVERLRATVTTPDGSYFLPVCAEAAAEITRLRAEVAELRTAVRVFAGHVEATGPSLRIASEVAGKLMKEPA